MVSWRWRVRSLCDSFGRSTSLGHVHKSLPPVLINHWLLWTAKSIESHRHGSFSQINWQCINDWLLNWPTAPLQWGHKFSTNRLPGEHIRLLWRMHREMAQCMPTKGSNLSEGCANCGSPLEKPWVQTMASRSLPIGKSQRIVHAYIPQGACLP